MISLVIPHYYGLENIDNILKKCIQSMVGQDETIVLANDGLGYGAACNLGMRLATRNFIVVSNNDCLLKMGNLQQLPDAGFITVPQIKPKPKDDLPRPFFCVPRKIYETIVDYYGDFYDERYKGGYWEDDDLHRRMEELQISSRLVDEVEVEHLNGGGTTMKQLGENEYYDMNKSVYDEKWQDLLG